VKRVSGHRHCIVLADIAGEDKELTAFLNEKIAAILSGSHEPRPACPQCGGLNVFSEGFKTRQIGRLPMFECQSCNRNFSRTAGTPLGEKHLKKLELFVTLLSQPISFVEAGERMGSLPDDIKKRVMAYRAWLLQLDPGGQWARRVRLGGRPAELTPAPLRFEEAGACEDLVLTARLTREFEAINSTSHRPLPPCLDCGSRKTVCAGHTTGFSRFQCLACKLRFTRRRGTPFVNTKASSFDRMRVFIRYLSLPL
jgi:transposase-like protein